MLPFEQLMQEVELPLLKLKKEVNEKKTESSSLPPSQPPPPPKLEKSFEEILSQGSSHSNAYLNPPSSFPSVQDIVLSDSDSEDEDGNIKIYKPPPPLNFTAPIPDEIREMYKEYDKKFDEAKAKLSKGVTSHKSGGSVDDRSKGCKYSDGEASVKKGFLLGKDENPYTTKCIKQTLSSSKSVASQMLSLSWS